MVQYPEIRGDSGVERVEKFEDAIERFGIEGHRVLMVMIPRADQAFWNNHGQRITDQ